MAASPDKIVVKTNDGAEVELTKKVYEQSSYLVEQVGLGSDSVIEMFDMDKDRKLPVLCARQFLAPHNGFREQARMLGSSNLFRSLAVTFSLISSQS